MGDLQQLLQASWPILLMIIIFYFLLYRPQKKQQKQRNDLLNNLKKGNKVVTIGGLYGEIVELDADTVVLHVADKVDLKFARTAVASVINKKNAAKKEEAVKEEK